MWTEIVRCTEWTKIDRTNRNELKWIDQKSYVIQLDINNNKYYISTFRYYIDYEITQYSPNDVFIIRTL